MLRPCRSHVNWAVSSACLSRPPQRRLMAAPVVTSRTLLTQLCFNSCTNPALGPTGRLQMHSKVRCILKRLGESAAYTVLRAWLDNLQGGSGEMEGICRPHMRVVYSALGCERLIGSGFTSLPSMSLWRVCRASC